MANVIEPTEEDRQEWETFVASRPAAVRSVAEKLKPWKLYQLKTSNHRVTLHSFDEHDDGTVTLKVDVTGEFNFVAFNRRVFGIKPEDLEECDLPAEGELLGNAGLNPHALRGGSPPS